MALDAEPKPSFSRLRKWGIAFNLLVRTAAVLAVVVMANYLSSRFFTRFYLNSQTRVELSPRTLSVLRALTNNVDVTLYYDSEDPLFTSVEALADEYRTVNPRIRVAVVDYLRDPGKAVGVMARYEKYNLAGSTNKDLVIFDCEGRVKIVYGNMLAHYTLEFPNPGEREIHRRTAFLGEMAFTSSLLAVSNPKPFQAWFLQGHGEHDPEGTGDLAGYLKFASVLQQNYVRVNTLSLLTNTVPGDCNLLIIAGPLNAIPESEIAKIEQYLLQGGRLLALVNPFANGRQTGLERILGGWGVTVGTSPVSDPDNSVNATTNDVIVGDPSTGTPLSTSQHPVVSPLGRLRLHLILPRPIGPQDVRNPPADAPHVVAIAWSGERASFVKDGITHQGRFPLAVAVENTVKGVITERGSTRIVAVGDSIFLGNSMIDSAANREFAWSVINWLLDRPVLLEGVGPRPIADFRLVIPQAQRRVAQWILLAGMPAAVLVFGSLIWLRRRK